MSSAGGGLSKPWGGGRPTVPPNASRSASTRWRARAGRAGRGPHIGRFVSASVDRAGGDRESVSGAPEGSFSKKGSSISVQ